MLDARTDVVIGAAIEVHRALGPGLLESAYAGALAVELEVRGVRFRREVAMPVAYKGQELGVGYRLDCLVGETVVVEVKSVDAIRPLHVAQTLTYLRLGRYPVGLLLNCNVPTLRQGITRLSL